jgi:Rad4 beta-hairpin domain 3
LPDECKWLDLPKVIPVCKRLQVEFVPAVIGFEKGGPAGFSHPTIKGVVVFRSDLKKIKTECDA